MLGWPTSTSHCPTPAVSIPFAEWRTGCSSLVRHARLGANRIYQDQGQLSPVKVVLALFIFPLCVDFLEGTLARGGAWGRVFSGELLGDCVPRAD
jgi:hypothetical protein